MNWLLLAEQTLNGVQLGVLLFLLAAGLTLVFGIMDLVNLAHGSFYMVGAFFAATFTEWTGSFAAGALLAVPAAMIVGMLTEVMVLRRLYARSHLDQVMVTFGLILFFNELVRLVWGPAGRDIPLPPILYTSLELIPGSPYPTYRLLIIGMGLAIAGLLYLLVAKTRAGMLIRAGASNRTMVQALGVNIQLLFTLVFGLGVGLAAFAGVMAGPIFTVSVGMGEEILILAFVVIVIGGIGSVRGAFFAAVMIGVVDTLGRAFLPDILEFFFSNAVADTAAPALSSMMIYLFMAVILSIKPQGLFPIQGSSAS